jgi:ribonuclease HII
VRTASTRTREPAARRSGPSARVRRPRAGLALERTLLADGHATVGGMDEVGRGAWAGPVVVGVVVIDASTGRLPKGTADSKLLTPTAREELEDDLVAWCASWATGEATAQEIDERGLSSALRLAAHRALAGLPRLPEALIVDGPFDFVGSGRDVTEPRAPGVRGAEPVVVPKVGADGTAGTVAAASILAKLSRDAQMRAHARRLPGYAFDRNKGYGTRDHAAAIAARGLSWLHRQTWSFALPTLEAQEPS